MAKQMISDLRPAEAVASAFRVESLRLVPFRNKPGQYLDLRLADAAGEMTARLWEQAEEVAEQLQVGQILEIRGRVEEYRGVPQIVISRLRLADPDRYEPADFMRVAPRPRDEMLAELQEAIAEVEEPFLRELLELIFGDEEFLARFSTSPGAVTLHHAYVSGLLEHTLSVVQLCRAAARQHPELSRDLMLAGALLHDVGKVFEIGGEAGYAYTDEGRFCGHIVLTDRFVLGRIAQVDGFPVQLANLLTHMLLSHHGQLEWGAPVKPRIPEAMALHYADNLDAKVQIAEEYRCSPEAGRERWSTYHHALETSLFLGPTCPEPQEQESDDPEQLL